jgi:hypothetical protein
MSKELFIIKEMIKNSSNLLQLQQPGSYGQPSADLNVPGGSMGQRKRNHSTEPTKQLIQSNVGVGGGQKRNAQ